jgi:hypothetical protein
VTASSTCRARRWAATPPRLPRRRVCGSRLRGLVALLLLGLATSSTAHQLQAALTTIEVNPHSERVEIVHRFYAHDAEHALDQVAGIRGDIRTDRALQEAFGRYVARRFSLTDADGSALEPELVGAEVDGDFLWVYQQLPGEDFERIARIGHDSLQEVWPQQENRVNLRRDDGVRTLILRKGDDLKAARDR